MTYPPPPSPPGLLNHANKPTPLFSNGMYVCMCIPLIQKKTEMVHRHGVTDDPDPDAATPSGTDATTTTTTTHINAGSALSKDALANRGNTSGGGRLRAAAGATTATAGAVAGPGPGASSRRAVGGDGSPSAPVSADGGVVGGDYARRIIQGTAVRGLLNLNSYIECDVVNDDTDGGTVTRNIAVGSYGYTATAFKTSGERLDLKRLLYFFHRSRWLLSL